MAAGKVLGEEIGCPDALGKETLFTYHWGKA